MINWKDRTIKFNSASCIEKEYLLRGIPCIKFAISSKLRDKIRPDKPKAVDNDIDIKPISAKHFFRMAQKKTTKAICRSYVFSAATALAKIT